MIAVLLAIAPTFILIILGYGLRRGGIPSTEFWNLNDRLVYWVLMPALFFAKISTADLGETPVGGLAAMLYGGFFVAVGFALVAQRLARLEPAQGSDVVQGAGRFNTFVGLAIAEALYGQGALQVAVVGSALLVPVVNLTMVTVLAAMHGAPGGNRALRLARDLATNPLILSILLGLLFNFARVGGLPVLHETASVLGQGALPVMLLCVGANLKVRGMQAAVLPTVLSAVGKLMVFPAAVVCVALALGLSGEAVQVALIYGALPVAVSAYTLARQMGGDTALMAAIITVQTLLAFVTIPLTLVLAEGLF
jgi:predicted permease